MWPWLSAHWSNVLGDVGIIAGLIFSGLGFRENRRTRRAQTVVELTKAHRDLWTLVRSAPGGSSMDDESRDLGMTPRTDAETEVVNLALLHLNGAFRASKAGIYVLPERLRDDIRDFFRLPIVLDAWAELKAFHDHDFVLFVDRAVASKEKQINSN